MAHVRARTHTRDVGSGRGSWQATGPADNGQVPSTILDLATPPPKAPLPLTCMVTVLSNSLTRALPWLSSSM